MEKDGGHLANERLLASSWLLANKILIDGGLLAMSILPAPFAVVVETQGLAFWLKFAQTVRFAFINHNPSSP